jgi:hypothetical protein
VVWSNCRKLKIYQVPTLALLHTWTPPNTSGSDILSVSFSADSALAIIETDSLNPLRVVNLTSGSFEIICSINISETVQYAHFLNASNNLVVVFRQSATVLLDLTTLSSYPLAPAVTAQAFAFDY